MISTLAARVTTPNIIDEKWKITSQTQNCQFFLQYKHYTVLRLRSGLYCEAITSPPSSTLPRELYNDESFENIFGLDNSLHATSAIQAV